MVRKQSGLWSLADLCPDGGPAVHWLQGHEQGT